MAGALKEGSRFAAALSGQLDGRRFLVGDQRTIADFAVDAHLAHVSPPTQSLTGHLIPAWAARLDGSQAGPPPPSLSARAPANPSRSPLRSLSTPCRRSFSTATHWQTTRHGHRDLGWPPVCDAARP